MDTETGDRKDVRCCLVRVDTYSISAKEAYC